MTKFDYEIDDFMSYCGSKSLSTKTTKSYEQTLRIFARCLEEIEKVISTKEATKEVAREYIVYLKEKTN